MDRRLNDEPPMDFRVSSASPASREMDFRTVPGDPTPLPVGVAASTGTLSAQIVDARCRLADESLMLIMSYSLKILQRFAQIKYCTFYVL